MNEVFHWWKNKISKFELNVIALESDALLPKAQDRFYISSYWKASIEAHYCSINESLKHKI